jgi:membrane-bound lytic murein transglycosylase A
MGFVLGEIRTKGLRGRCAGMATITVAISLFLSLSMAPARANGPSTLDGWTAHAVPATTGSIEKPKGFSSSERMEHLDAKRQRVPSKRESKPVPAPGGKAVHGRSGRATLEPVTFGDLPGWADDDHLAALKAFQASCPQVVAGKAGKSTGPDAAALVAACTTALALPPKMTRMMARAFFESQFRPHRIVHSGPEGLLTGYYEPVIEGSRVRQGRFQTPLFKRPADLVSVRSGARGSLDSSLTYARRTSAGLVPFATRAEIDAGALSGKNLELLYLANPVDIYFLQIQGSGRIQLQDGTFVRVQYAGKNGHPYTSIGRYLIDKGLLAADKVSMGALGRWLKADLARAREVMNQNASYVFFREMPADTRGPHGAFDVALIAGRSLAIDPRFHRLGSLIYVSGPSLVPKGKSRAFNHLMVAHDVGGAIKGAERADIYFGTGDHAASQAGGVRHRGHLFDLVPKVSRFEPVAERPVPKKQ